MSNTTLLHATLTLAMLVVVAAAVWVAFRVSRPDRVRVEKGEQEQPMPTPYEELAEEERRYLNWWLRG